MTLLFNDYIDFMLDSAVKKRRVMYVEEILDCMDPLDCIGSIVSIVEMASHDGTVLYALQAFVVKLELLIQHN